MSQFPVDDKVILASAGSGKTFALSDRIVKLLATGAKPEQIVALTFTRAAAAEFMARTLEKLAKAASSEEEAADLRSRLELASSRDAAFFRDLLRKTLLSMQRLTLGTLDSFFARLVTNNPTEVGLDGGRISNISDVEAADIRTQVIAQMMAETEPAEIAELWDLLRFLNQGKEVATPLKGFAETVKSLHDLISLAKEEHKWGDSLTLWKDGRPEIFQAPTEVGKQQAALGLAAWLEGQTFHATFKKSLMAIAESVGAMTHASDLKDSAWENLGGRLRPVILGKMGEAITITLPDGTEYEADLIGSDAASDLAVLKIRANKTFPFVKFGDSSSARVGDWVVAIGNPFGLGGT
ncbi:MAG: hypothetical protein EBR70_05960, partial [Verrucomicrobia bacterium]|nr:hypothetical protein [Verrucomicrobiota bacterium]